MRAESTSTALLALLTGPLRAGAGLGAGHIEFPDRVVSLTRPGAPRMPNGIECQLVVEQGQTAWIGEGRLQSGGRTVLPGTLWNPVPRPLVRLQVDQRLKPDPRRLAGRGGGLTPAWDDVIAGYVAALLLFGDRREEAAATAEAAARRTTSLSATLLRHAALGELPEPAFALLERGDPEPLRRFGHSSGRALIVGLALGAAAC